MATNFSYSKLNKDWSHLIIISSSFLRHVQLQLSEESMLTCDQAFFFSGERESVAARELAVGRREKKERLIQLLHESSAAPCLLT